MCDTLEFVYSINQAWDVRSSPATVRHSLIPTTGRVQDVPAAVLVNRLTGLLVRACFC